MSSLKDQMQALAARAKAASNELAALSSDEKNRLLHAMAASLNDYRKHILQANAKDVQEGRETDVSPALLDRLLIDDSRLDAMIQGFADVSSLQDPVGTLISEKKLENGLLLKKVRVPIGVIGMIYESRPNVTADVSALCLKTANAVILRGGSESLRSNMAIAESLKSGIEKANGPKDSVQLVHTKDRDAVKHLVQLNDWVDLIIPRGGEGLIAAVLKHATVPVIKHYKGLCHTYVDKDAAIDMAVDICENAKCQRPGVCNAMETLLVHQDIADKFLPQLAQKLLARGVELRGDEDARRMVPQMGEATEEDWSKEYLDLILAVRVVPSIEAAIEHINTYGSHHSDAIVTGAQEAAQQFLKSVDSATVYHNASTRFTDGAMFGMGAEIGISTDKLHARGPMGLEELTTYKYVIEGTGQIRN